MAHVLIVEDDPDAARALADLVAQSGFDTSIALTLAQARTRLALDNPGIVLLDVQLPDGSGLDLFEGSDVMARAEVVLITAHASVETSVAALRRGAADYLIKPITAAQLDAVLERWMPPATLDAEREDAHRTWLECGRFAHLWGRSRAMQVVYEQLARVAASSITVLITGESGTGKELVARSVHEMSRRRHGPFLAINCGAISPRLIESELFGHERGAFTGADRAHVGFFERAHGGTLFLDELTEMPPELQVKLLRVLETGSYLKVGSTHLQHADVRVVAACNRSPAEAVSTGRLREDLYYRLNVFPISMPPLRDRGDDVILLADRFLEEFAQRERMVKRWSPAAHALLQAYRWPGNVRELRNVVQRACLMELNNVIGEAWIPRNAPLSADDVQRRTGEIVIPIGTSAAEAERQLILATLKHFGGRRDQTAAALGLSLKTLYNRLKSYGAEEISDDEDPDLEHPQSQPAAL